MSIITPNTKSIDSHYERAKFLLAWRISLLFLILFGILTTNSIANKENSMLPFLMALAVIIITSIHLKATRNTKPFFWVYAISGTFIVNFALNYVLDFTHYVDFLWLIAIILLAFIGLGWSFGILFTLLNATGMGVFFWFTLNNHIETIQPRSNIEIIGDFVEVLFALFVVTYLMRQFVLFQRYAEKSLKKANANLEEQNKLIRSKNTENETLMKEIHHRVKNNLQIVISLLRMQQSELKSEESRNQFSEAINRIMAMSLIHQKLYGEKELSKVNLKSYLEELVSEIKSIFPDNEKISTQIHSQVENINLDTIVPLGLLINELVSNSLKYAFTNEKNGEISIEITQKENEYRFVYSDSGKWLEPNKNNSSFGLELIDILTQQLNGEKSIETENGTKYHFTLRDTIPA